RGLDRPATFARIRDAAAELGEVGILEKLARGKVEEPGADDAAAPPDLAYVGEVELVAIGFRVLQRRGFGIGFARLQAGIGVPQDMDPLAIAAHQPVLEAVVDHLAEVAGARRAAVHIAALGSRLAPLATGDARRSPDAGCERRKDRIEPRHHFGLAADHQAET